MQGPLDKSAATASEKAQLIIELVLSRGARAVRVKPDKREDYSTGEELSLPTFTGGVWWNTKIELDCERLELPHYLVAIRDSVFYWRYDDESNPKQLWTFTRQPEAPTVVGMRDEFYRRYYHMTETLVPALGSRIKMLQDDIDRLKNLYERAPQLVPRDDGSVIVQLVSMPRTMGRADEEKKRAEEQEKKLTDGLEQAKLPLLRPVFQHLQRCEVRIKVLEDNQKDLKKLQKDMTHLQEQMEEIFRHFKIKPLNNKAAPKGRPTTAEGKLPVKKKSEKPSSPKSTNDDLPVVP